MIQRHDPTKKDFTPKPHRCKAKQPNGTSPQFYYSGFVPECQVTERIFIMTPEEKRKLEIIKGILEDLKAITRAENMTVSTKDNGEREATA